MELNSGCWSHCPKLFLLFSIYFLGIHCDLLGKQRYLLHWTLKSLGSSNVVKRCENPGEKRESVSGNTLLQQEGHEHASFLWSKLGVCHLPTARTQAMADNLPATTNHHSPSADSRRKKWSSHQGSSVYHWVFEVQFRKQNSEDTGSI